MDPIQQRIASLTPERRALLEQRLMTAAAGTAQERIPRRAGRTPRPLSFAQERLWFLDQLLPGGVAYNTSHAVRIRGALDVEALRRALDASVTRHEALRTVFVEKDGVPLQAIVDHVPTSLPVLDLRQQPDGEREAVMRQHLEAEIGQSFDLARGPLWRTRLVRLGDLEHVLLLAIHHIVFDGWSLGVLWQELATNYEAFVAGGPSPLLPVARADRGLCRVAAVTLDGRAPGSESAYWTRTLAGAPVLSRCRWITPPGRLDRPGRQHFLEIPAELVDRLTKLSRQERATLFMTLLAAFQTLLCPLHRSERHRRGHGPRRPHAHRAGGDRSAGSPAPGDARRPVGRASLLSSSGSAREVTLGGTQHQELPFERLVEDLAPERSVSHGSGIPDACSSSRRPAVALNAPGTRGDSPGATEQRRGARGRHDVLPGDRAAGASRPDRVQHRPVRRRHDCAAWSVPPATWRGIGGRPRPAPRGAARSCRWRSASECRRVERRPRPNIPREACVHQLIEAQAQRTPDAVAVVCDGRRADLPGAGPPGDTPGGAAARRGGRARYPGWPLRRPLARDGGRPHRDPQGRRGRTFPWIPRIPWIGSPTCWATPGSGGW